MVLSGVCDQTDPRIMVRAWDSLIEIYPIQRAHTLWRGMWFTRNGKGTGRIVIPDFIKANCRFFRIYAGSNHAIGDDWQIKRRRKRINWSYRKSIAIVFDVAKYHRWNLVETAFSVSNSESAANRGSNGIRWRIANSSSYSILLKNDLVYSILGCGGFPQGPTPHIGQRQARGIISIAIVKKLHRQKRLFSLTWTNLQTTLELSMVLAQISLYQGR